MSLSFYLLPFLSGFETSVEGVPHFAAEVNTHSRAITCHHHRGASNYLKEVDNRWTITSKPAGELKPFRGG